MVPSDLASLTGGHMDIRLSPLNFRHVILHCIISSKAWSNPIDHNMAENVETIVLHPRPGEDEPFDISPSWTKLAAAHGCFTSTCEYCPNRPYVSLRIPADEAGKRIVVRRVIFTTTSRDQGFASHASQDNGTYRDAYAYFEVSAVDANGQDRINREVLHHLLRATPRVVNHVVCWDHRDDSIYQTEMRERPVDSGMVPSQWINAIRGGDAIQIVPRADHPAWVN
jgi:hypothetical protein